MGSGNKPHRTGVAGRVGVLSVQGWATPRTSVTPSVNNKAAQCGKGKGADGVREASIGAEEETGDSSASTVQDLGDLDLCAVQEFGQTGAGRPKDLPPGLCGPRHVLVLGPSTLAPSVGSILGVSDPERGTGEAFTAPPQNPDAGPTRDQHTRGMRALHEQVRRFVSSISSARRACDGQTVAGLGIGLVPATTTMPGDISCAAGAQAHGDFKEYPEKLISNAARGGPS